VLNWLQIRRPWWWSSFVVKPVVHGICINPEGEKAIINLKIFVLRLVGCQLKQLIH